MYSWANGLKQGFKNLFRNRLFTLASIGTITACLFLLGMFYCIVVNFQGIYSEVETTVGVTVFFDSGVKEDQINQIKAQIQARDDVDKVNYTSAEEAWAQYKEKVFPNNKDNILTNLDSDNPLADSASLEVYLKDASSQDQVIDYIKSIDGVRSVNASESAAKNLSSIGKLLGYASAGIIIILLGVAIFLISNTVRIGIAVRHEEIAIMKYLGATDFFVRAPFLVEGMLIGLIGSVIPLCVLRYLYARVVTFVTSQFSLLSALISFTPVGEVFRLLVPITLLIGLGMGFLGSWFTLIRRVRV
ncbi:MAG TPA: ABC transporter permease [Lachnospiraceae bacterium]|nr:ABC transporter permease [Lachnospiraceae bacterium]